MTAQATENTHPSEETIGGQQVGEFPDRALTAGKEVAGHVLGIDD